MYFSLIVYIFIPQNFFAYEVIFNNALCNNYCFISIKKNTNTYRELNFYFEIFIILYLLILVK